MKKRDTLVNAKAAPARSVQGEATRRQPSNHVPALDEVTLVIHGEPPRAAEGFKITTSREPPKSSGIYRDLLRPTTKGRGNT